MTDEIDHEHRLLQALNCLLVETPAGRVLVETGIGERITDKVREMRQSKGTPIVPALVDAGFDPASVDIVAMSHLHFDHAGGLLLADGSRAFPRATIVGQRAEWEIALDDNPRLVASYDQPEIRLVRSWGEEGWADGERELLPGVSVVPTGGHSAGHQAVVVRGAGDGAGRLASSATCACGRGLRIRAGFLVRRLPAGLGRSQGFAVRSSRRRGWVVALSHEPVAPIGRLVRDRDRYRYEAR